MVLGHSATDLVDFRQQIFNLNQNMSNNHRTFALPFESQTYTFNMNFEYDSWKICASRTKRKLVFFSEAQPNLREANRIQKMTYPDGEVVTYDYNRGGMLPSGLGGTYGSHFTYDNLYRLAYADGNWHGNNTLSFVTSLDYEKNGRISRKVLSTDTWLN